MPNMGRRRDRERDPAGAHRVRASGLSPFVTAPTGVAVDEILLVRPLLHAVAMRIVIGRRNMKKTFVIVIWLALMVPAAARAQGIWLQKGVSGVGAQLSVEHQDGANGYSLLGAYSYQGFLDLELSLGWLDTSMIDIPDLSVYTLGAGVIYHPLKQTKEVPLSLKVAADYRQTFFSSDMLKENDSSLSGWDAVFSGGAYRFFPLAERIGVTPEIDLGWHHASASATILGDTQTTTDDTLVILLGASLAYLDSSGHIWGLSPALTFGPGNTPTTFGLAVSFVSTLPGAR